MGLRVDRLKEVIREEAAELILHGLTDPRLGFCTVTRVELTNDLAYCTIHVSVLGDEGSKSKTMHALQDARGLIQKKVAKRLKTRTTPHVTIELDESIEKSFTIMNKIKEARESDSDRGIAPPTVDPDAEPANPKEKTDAE